VHTIKIYAYQHPRDGGGATFLFGKLLALQAPSSAHGRLEPMIFQIPLCTKVNIRCVATAGFARWKRNPSRNPYQVFLGEGPEQSAIASVDFLSCRAGCEFITITISIARREAAEKSHCPSAASIGPDNTTEELAQCSLINCWSHAQNVTHGRWPCTQGRSHGRRERPWFDLPAPSAAIGKSVLAAL
jgi:hypothetical protein